MENMKIREDQQIYRPDMLNILLQIRNGQLNDMNDVNNVFNGSAANENNESFNVHLKHKCKLMMKL